MERNGQGRGAMPGGSTTGAVDAVRSHCAPRHFHVQIADGPAYACSSVVPLLQALPPALRATIPAGCFGGGCGICRIRVLNGHYRCGAMSRARITEDDERQGIVLACQVYPLSDLAIEPVAWRAKSGTTIDGAAGSVGRERD